MEPTTASDGNSTAAEAISASTSPRVLVWVRWWIVVPCSVTATGVDAGAAGGQQVAQGAAEALGGAEHHDGDVVAGRAGPVDLGVAAADDVQHRRRGRGQRDTGVGGHGRDRADAGHDLEGDAGLAAGQRLLGEAVEGGRVAVHEADHEAAVVRGTDRLGRLDDELGPVGVGQRLAVLAVAGVDDLDSVADEPGEELLAADLVDDDGVGGSQELAGADGQQAGVAGAGADEDDPRGVLDSPDPGAGRAGGGGGAVRGDSVEWLSA